MPTTSSGDTSGRRILKIAQVIGSASGGVMSCVMNYYRHVDRNLVQFDFFTYAPSRYDDEIKSLGGKVFHFPNIFKPSAVTVLKKYFCQNGYDAVHAHLTTRSGFALKAAKQAGIAVRICHAHSTAHPAEGLAFLAKNVLKPFAKKYATHFAGCSKLSIEWLFGKREKAFLMKNALDLNRFCYAEKPNGIKTVGFVGRFVFQKNLFFLMEVFCQLAQMRNDVQFVLVGGGKDADALQKQARKINAQVIFLPERADVEKAYASFDVFALPSRFEGMPLVAIEAQACGAACVISNKVSREADAGNATFLPIDDAKTWAQTISRLLDEPRKCITSQQMAQLGYDISCEAPKLVQFYQTIVAEN